MAVLITFSLTNTDAIDKLVMTLTNGQTVTTLGLGPAPTMEPYVWSGLSAPVQSFSIDGETLKLPTVAPSTTGCNFLSPTVTTCPLYKLYEVLSLPYSSWTALPSYGFSGFVSSPGVQTVTGIAQAVIVSKTIYPAPPALAVQGDTLLSFEHSQRHGRGSLLS